ncbi:MAG: DUF4065 domain-containing protein [Clostridiales bacterium]|nr:DUF4065 domain-containing protein [Clostridiales bacterium]
MKNMKIIFKEKKLCLCCMEEHEVKTVRTKSCTVIKDVKVDYEAEYFYCDRADEFLADERMIKENDMRLRNAYRKKTGLLTSDEISGIRSKYGISQEDLCTVLGWGIKTVTRYEGRQIQDTAHDAILRKLDEDPEWFLVQLDKSKEQISREAYKRYFNIASNLYGKYHDDYLRRAIEAQYAPLQSVEMGKYTGNTSLSLDKVVDMIRYFANSRCMEYLYKVKLMKLLWFSDYYSCKTKGHAITGLAYRRLAMGAVPIGSNSIIELNGVAYEEEINGEFSGYHFVPSGNQKYPNLSKEEIDVLDIIIQKFCHMKAKEIVAFMHQERAYLETSEKDMISFEYAKDLSF